MTILEKKSNRKKLAILNQVKNGDMSVAYALSETERLNDENKLLDKDYEEVAEYLESLLQEDTIETVEENTIVEETEESEVSE